MKDLLNAIIKLLKVKSIWSLVAASMFIFLTVTDRIKGEVALSVVTSIVTYYFVKTENKEA